MQLIVNVIFVALFCAGSRNMVVHGTAVAPGMGYDNGHVGKKGLSYLASPDYASDHGFGGSQRGPQASCSKEQDYEISQNYIIRTKDSKANGATFVAALIVRTFDACLEQCCLKEKCDTTIFVQEVDAYDPGSDQPNCFLFECRPQGETGQNHCLFTYHIGYISSIKKIHGGFQSPVMPVAPNRPATLMTSVPDVEVQLTTTTRAPYRGEPAIIDDGPPSSCDEGHFQCLSGECINALYVCNDIFDCKDESDEHGCHIPESNPGHQQSHDGWNAWQFEDSSSVVDVGDGVEAHSSMLARPHQGAGSHDVDGAEKPFSVPVDDSHWSRVKGQKQDAQAPIDTSENAPESEVIIVAPPESGMTTKSRTVEQSSTAKPETNFATNSEEIESGGGGGMPPASSAILPLVIGLVITMCLLLMVGCRLRYMNQRLRYGRLKTSANDADYLINGMYL